MIMKIKTGVINPKAFSIAKSYGLKVNINLSNLPLLILKNSIQFI
jgi:hypothetical protein